jgi:hypothetical protein
MTRIRTTPRLRQLRRVATLIALLHLALVTASPTAGAQLVAIKTLPIADGDQFSFFPTPNAGMAGVSIAIADSAHDFFINPAKGSRVRRASLFSTLTHFSVSNYSGTGSTLPIGAMARSGSSFGAGAVAIQSITDGHRPPGPPPPGIFTAGDGTVDAGTGDSHGNRVAFAMLGHTFAASKISLGASALWARVNAIDGVKLLYPDSRSVQLSGGIADMRVGMLKEWRGGQSLEALVLSRRMDVHYDVGYTDLYWDGVRRQPIEVPRLEASRDETQTWGIHLQYQRPVADSSWRLGAVVTANRVDQPNRPRYDIASLPGDRGRSAAFNVGLGLARSWADTRVAVDAIYEPITSRIRALADSAIATPSSATMRTGGTTIDSRLRFSNALVRVGASHDLAFASGPVLRLQLGAQAHSNHYRLHQNDLVSASTRSGTESWTEVTRSWGLSLRSPAFEAHYAGHLTSGAGRPGASPPGVFPVLDSTPIPGPTAGRTTISGVRVATHQFSISLPFR